MVNVDQQDHQVPRVVRVQLEKKDLLAVLDQEERKARAVHQVLQELLVCKDLPVKLDFLVGLVVLVREDLQARPGRKDHADPQDLLEQRVKGVNGVLLVPQDHQVK